MKVSSSLMLRLLGGKAVRRHAQRMECLGVPRDEKSLTCSCWRGIHRRNGLLSHLQLDSQDAEPHVVLASALSVS